jgi:F420-dependent oxidoreductase-like protein
MMEIAIMIEGQNGLNWPRWQRIVQAVEELGFVGLYRSDHFVNADPPDMDSLELWVSLTWLASHTERIEFGPLVTPFSFRHPAFTARMARDVDDLSGGRLTLGVGAGWMEREHSHYGFDLLGPAQRFARFREGLEVVTRLLRSDEPLSFNGQFYRLKEATLLPRPEREGGPSILIGGNGLQRTLPLAAQYADEWNGVLIPATKFRELNAQLDGLLKEVGRKPAEVRRSLMTGIVFGRNQVELNRKVTARGSTVAELRRHGLVAGTPAEVVNQLEQFAQAGVQRIMLQWLELDDLTGLEALARAVLP